MISGLNKVSASNKKRTLTAIGNIFLFTDVGNAIGMAQGWSVVQIGQFHEDMLLAIRSGSLEVRSRLTGLPTAPSESLWQYVHPNDVDEWLEQRGLDYRCPSPNERVLGDIVKPKSGAPAWHLKPPSSRMPGYRWPLFQVLQAAYAAGKPCPKARDVLHTWQSNPQPELEVMSDGVRYNDGKGNRKEANLKAIQQSIKGLLEE